MCGAFVSGADYLLLDEPTNHLTAGREWLYHQLESWQGGALIASHDRELLTRMPRIIELTPTALRSYGGNYDEYQRQRMAEQQRAALEHAVTDRRRTRARMHKEHDAAQRRSAQTLRTVDTKHRLLRTREVQRSGKERRERCAVSIVNRTAVKCRRSSAGAG